MSGWAKHLVEGQSSNVYDCIILKLICEIGGIISKNVGFYQFESCGLLKKAFNWGVLTIKFIKIVLVLVYLIFISIF